MFWVMILTTVLTNGDVYTEVRWPTKTEMNSEAECNRQADIAAGEEQLKVGLNNGKVVYTCQSIPLKDIKNLVLSNSDI